MKFHTYTKLNRLCQTVFHYERINRVYFSKEIKVPRGNAKVIVSVDKPFVISYLKKKQQVMLRCHNCTTSLTNMGSYLKVNRTVYEVHVTHDWPITVQSSRLNEAGHLS